MFSFDGSDNADFAVKVQLTLDEHWPSLIQGTALAPFDQMMSARPSPS